MALYSEKAVDHFRTPRRAGVIASGSMATEMIKGKLIFRAVVLTNKALEGPPTHMHSGIYAPTRSPYREYGEGRGI